MKRSDKVLLFSNETTEVLIDIDDDGDLFIEQESQCVMIHGADIDDFVQELRNLVERKRVPEPLRAQIDEDDGA